MTPHLGALADLRVVDASTLFAGTDVVIENFRPDTLERWRLGYPELSAGNAACCWPGSTVSARSVPTAGALASARSPRR